jgi:hypothetical protein
MQKMKCVLGAGKKGKSLVMHVRNMCCLTQKKGKSKNSNHACTHALQAMIKKEKSGAMWRGACGDRSCMWLLYRFVPG